MNYKEAYDSFKKEYGDTHYYISAYHMVKGEDKPILKNWLTINISDHIEKHEYEHTLKEMKSIEESPDFICWCVDKEKMGKYLKN